MNKLAIRLLLMCLCAAGLGAQAQPVVLKLTLHDTIQPITSDYLRRGLDHAAQIHAEAVLLSLGTPGGLLDSTRTMVAAIEASPVPVIVFISPAGSRAGSAGFFLLEAADIAAMAPGTNAGAAHPIVEGKQLDPILKEKIENDAAAFLRSYTERRGRNTQAAEDAVRNSKSFSADEALKLNLIDLVEPDDHALLAALDGREIRRFDGSRVTLHTRAAEIVSFAPSLRERLLTKLTNPDLAVLLLVLGGLLIYLEFNIPGTVVPGALGTMLVLLSLFGLNLLPVRHTAILLLVAAMVMILLETKFASHGILALAGTLSLVFGLATLVDGPIAELRVHLGTAIGAGIGFGAISFSLCLDRPARTPQQDPAGTTGHGRRGRRDANSPSADRPDRNSRRALAGYARSCPKCAAGGGIGQRSGSRRPDPDRRRDGPTPGLTASSRARTGID